MLFAMLFKVILKFLEKRKFLTRKYTNEYMLNRITGVVFDFMIVASIMSINIEIFKDTGSYCFTPYFNNRRWLLNLFFI